MNPNVQSRHYDTADGLACHYLFWPNPHSDSCCLLLHGFTNDAHIWDDLAVQLQTQHNVIAVDFRGHGDSDWDPEARYTHPQLVADILALTSQQAFSRYHIIGHSLGARVALLMLVEHADLAASLTIIDTGPEVRAVGVDKVRKDAENMPTRFASIDAYYQFLSGIYWFADAGRLRKLAQFGLRRDEKEGWICKTDPAFTAALWKSGKPLGGSQDLRYPMNDQLWHALETLACPALVIRGQASAILSPAVARRMIEVIPDGRLLTIDKAGHAVMVDNPLAFEQGVLDFLGQL